MLRVENLSVEYTVEGRTIRALDDVSLSVESGDILGIVGESGCGKSTLIKTIQRILPNNATVTSGSILFDGEDILEMSESEFRKKHALKNVSLVPQASMDSLDPVYTVREQLRESMEAHRDAVLNEDEDLESRIESRIENMGLDPSVMDKYPHELSGGQVQRVLIANSFILDPQVVLADEPTTGLDLLTQNRILRWLKELQENREFTLIAVSHDLPLVAQLQGKLGVMYAGELVEFGDAVDVFSDPTHPYTMGLLESTMHVHRESEVGHIPGSPPSLSAPPTGCKYRDRCPFSYEACEESPELLPVNDEGSQQAACHLSGTDLEEAKKSARESYAK